MRFHSLGRGLLHLNIYVAVLSFRPRDIIVYFNKIRACHKNNVSGLYTSNELYEVDREASISVYNEVIDEWSNQFPEIENLLTVLQTIQVETFDFNDFPRSAVMNLQVFLMG